MGTGKPLLVVDDSPLNRNLLARRLQRAGYPVETAEDGEQALAIIQSRQIELVLLDYMMPGMSGVDLLKLLRTTYSAAELPVIMVTALSESEKVVEALNLGANDYLTKPIDFEVALARIQVQLNRKQAEESLRKSAEGYALAARSANDGLWDWDLNENRIRYSPRWKAMLGYSEEEIQDSPQEWLRRVHPDDREALLKELAAWKQGGGEEEFLSEHRVLHKDGMYRWMRCRGLVVRAEDGRAVRMAGSQIDVTQGKMLDPLTGLVNRAVFNERLSRALARFTRDSSYQFAVLFLDLDRFKTINDSLGHAAGDQLLVAVARRVQSAVRTAMSGRRHPTEDTVARMGGDEFAVLLEDLETPAEAERVAERILAELGKPFELEGRHLLTSGSVGIAFGSAEHTAPAEILRDADTALYSAKSQGKGRWETFDAEMRATAKGRLELEENLRRALRDGEFLLHYQPTIRLETAALAGFDALLRWQHPEQGLVMPSRFLSVAEQTGLIVPIGWWVLKEACSTMRLWHSEFPSSTRLRIGLHLSTRQFRLPDLVERISETLGLAGLEPSCVQLELAESALIEDPASAPATLKRLKGLGVCLQIDDFGTGYSSLHYLNQLPFDSLKIHRSFVQNMCHNQTCAEIVKTAVALARSLGIEVTADGVETDEQLEWLKVLGCDFVQGHLFSKPLDQSQARELLANAGEWAFSSSL